MRLAAALCASLLLASTPGLADPGPLPPGKPAGARVAQSEDSTLYILTGVAILGLIIGIAASTGSSSPNTSAISAAP